MFNSIQFNSVRRFSGLYSIQMRENTDQKNSECELSSRSENDDIAKTFDDIFTIVFSNLNIPHYQDLFIDSD